LEFQTRTDYSGRGAGFPQTHALLANLESGARFGLEKTNGFGGWCGTYDGQCNFDSGAAILAGDYSLFLKSIPTDNQPSLCSYALNISLGDSPLRQIHRPPQRPPQPIPRFSSSCRPCLR
jgi:hypothetical protein